MYYNSFATLVSLVILTMVDLHSFCVANVEVCVSYDYLCLFFVSVYLCLFLFFCHCLQVVSIIHSIVHESDHHLVMFGCLSFFLCDDV